jgi:acrylyl-CoA reductase (NADPH)
MIPEEQRFRALVVEQQEKGVFRRSIRERAVGDLPSGDLLVQVHYSSLNYKDALSATGHPGVTREFPHTPGIDAAGTVVSCEGGTFAPGDRVIITGYDLGMETDGGFGGYIRIPATWAVPLPEGMSLRQSMIYGTAGFTAALCLWKLRSAEVVADAGEVLVTGASGGVGSIAVALLAKAGYQVVAVTGKAAEHGYLRNLGAAGIVEREAVLVNAERPMAKERWAGAIDVVGGAMLASVLKAIRYGGAVACCGLVGSAELPLNVYPFILRGVSLLGVDSVQCPRSLRLKIWQHLATDWLPACLEETVTEIDLAGLEEQIEAMLKGQGRGRVIVRHPGQ